MFHDPEVTGAPAEPAPTPAPAKPAAKILNRDEEDTAGKDQLESMMQLYEETLRNVEEGEITPFSLEP